jgi:putative NIF3 family GTP cyclohydrolase 1 type 2
MERRDFLEKISFAGIATCLNLPDLSGPVKTALDLQNYLRSLIVVDEPSTDRIIIGDPETKIRKIGTCWMPHWELCREAVQKGVNVLVTHEPTFYTHWDLEADKRDYLAAAEPARSAYMAQRDKKAQWIRDNGLVIIRCHDVMDKLGEIGMPFALGQAMGFSNQDIIRSRNYYNVYGVKPMSAFKAAKMIARRLKEGKQPGVGFYGDGARVIQSIGVGCGYYCDPLIFMDLKPDLFVVINDTIKTWIQGSYCLDSGDPMVVIDHGVSEEYGMRLLRTHLEKNLPGQDVLHFKRGCTYQWVTA